jgi:plasmid stability protein
MQVKWTQLQFGRPASWMATLQIRDLPDPLHQMMLLMARQHRSSLSQQALSDLQQSCGGDPRERRRQALADLQSLAI